MQYQICDPKGFAEMLAYIIEYDDMPELPFIRKWEIPVKYKIEKLYPSGSGRKTSPAI